nr:hypothetical protein [Lachnospiraceae bacterium]
MKKMTKPIRVLFVLSIILGITYMFSSTQAKATQYNKGTYSMYKNQVRMFTIGDGSSDVTWKVENTNVLKYSSNNYAIMFSGKKIGKTKIYAYVGSDIYIYTVKIKKNKGKAYINVSKITMNNKSKFTLGVYSVKGKGKWKVKNKKILKLKPKGKKKRKCVIIGKNPGTTTVTCKAKKKKLKCNVTIRNSSSSSTTNPEIQKLNNIKIASGDAVTAKFSTTTKEVTVNPTTTTKVGTLESDGYEIEIPAGTFTTSTKIKVVSNGKILSITANDQDYCRLEEAITIRMKLTSNASVSDLPYYRGVYYFNNESYYITPDVTKLESGTLEFQTDHLSDYSALKIAKAHLIKNQAMLDAINSYTADQQNALAGETISSFSGLILDEMGITEDNGLKERRDKIMKQLGKSADFIALLRSGYSGDESTFTSKSSEIILKTVCENIDDQAWFGYVTAAAGSVPQAITDIREGKYAEASKNVMKAVASNIGVVKVTQFYASIWEAQIQQWTDT